MCIRDRYPSCFIKNHTWKAIFHCYRKPNIIVLYYLLLSSQPTSLLSSTAVIRCNKVPAQYKGKIILFYAYLFICMGRIPIWLRLWFVQLQNIKVIYHKIKLLNWSTQKKSWSPPHLLIWFCYKLLKIPMPKTYFNSVEFMRVRWKLF